jgi:hypothetical protein
LTKGHLSGDDYLDISASYCESSGADPLSTLQYIVDLRELRFQISTFNKPHIFLSYTKFLKLYDVSHCSSLIDFSEKSQSRQIFKILVWGSFFARILGINFLISRTSG